jgi:hypothetical protein
MIYLIPKGTKKKDKHITALQLYTTCDPKNISSLQNRSSI